MNETIYNSKVTCVNDIIDYCDGNPCGHGRGTCVETGPGGATGYECLCYAGFIKNSDPDAIKFKE